jgi:hypothetical protein
MRMRHARCAVMAIGLRAQGNGIEHWALRACLQFAVYSLQGGSTQFPVSISWFLGCSLGPFPFASAIKCHQKSTCNSAGSSAGRPWYLVPPRATGHPAAGRCSRPCRASTSLAPLYSPHAVLAFGWGSKPPSRSALGSSRGVLPGPRNTLSVSSAIRPRDSCLLFRAPGLQNETNGDTIAITPGRGAAVIEPRDAL